MDLAAATDALRAISFHSVGLNGRFRNAVSIWRNRADRQRSMGRCFISRFLLQLLLAPSFGVDNCSCHSLDREAQEQANKLKPTPWGPHGRDVRGPKNESRLSHVGGAAQLYVILATRYHKGVAVKAKLALLFAVLLVVTQQIHSQKSIAEVVLSYAMTP